MQILQLNYLSEDGPQFLHSAENSSVVVSFAPRGRILAIKSVFSHRPKFVGTYDVNQLEIAAFLIVFM